MIATMYRGDIIRQCFERVFQRRTNPINGIDLTIDHLVTRSGFRVKLEKKDIHIGYIFEIDNHIDAAMFKELVTDEMIKAHNQMRAKIDAHHYGGMYDHPYALTVEEERELAEELRKVKEGFYNRAKRDANGNRLSKEELEKYDKVEGFGQF
jgi:hypothetical protein